MVLCLKIKKEKTQEAKKFLVKNKLLNTIYVIGKSGKYSFLVLNEGFNKSKLITKFNGSIEERNIPKVKWKGVMNLKEALKAIIPADKAEHMNRGFESIGDIAIFEVPDELVPLEKSIAWTLKRIKKNINIVAKKNNKTSGKYRIRKVKVLVGENRTETIHKESNVKLKTDLNKAYFSPRMSSERLRILKLIKKKENILVLFAGVGPYPIVFAKHRSDINITAIEWNPAAIRYFKENLNLNNLDKRITLIGGDVHVEVPKLKTKFDRIIMVLPSGAHDFLKEALSVAKKGATIHLYQFEHEDKVDQRANEIKQLVEKLGYKIKSIKGIRSGYYSPKINRYSYDIVLST
jgi:tRNA (guanine37-N1)-methyltransferase